MFSKKIIYCTLFFLLYAPEALASTFVDDTGVEFNAGTYSSTVFDTDHVELSSGQTGGTFTSQVFDGGATVSWTTLSWSETLPNQNKFVTVDVAASIFKSTNSASTFSSINADYNGAGANAGVDDLVVTSGKVLYLLHNTAVWRSSDYGVTWTERTAAYGGAAGLFMAVEGDDDLYIADGGEDIWRSSDGGANWTQVADNMNGGSGNILAMTAYGTTLFLIDAVADVWTSTNNGGTWTVVNTDYNAAVGDAGTDYLTANSSGHLFAARNAAVYRSTDSGVNWTEVNANYGDTDINVMDVDSSGNIYLVNTQEEVYRSTNNGTSFSQVSTGDINGANGDVEGFVIFPIAVDLTFSARSGDTNPPSGVFAGTLTDPSGGSTGVSNARYFQYRASFSTDDVAVTPELSLVTVAYEASDTTSPSAVSNLSLGDASDNAITVSWTAPGDDGSSGTATTYDLRYSTALITDGNFSSASQVTGEPTPSLAGSSESKVVTGLSSNTTYYFALKTSDEIPNTSALSNVPSLATTNVPDTTAPAAVSNLSLSNASDNSITVSWTAPGDDGSTGTATTYDLRYSTSLITSGNFSSATQVTGEPTPGIAGNPESKIVSGLAPSTTYFFALMTLDEVSNTSTLSNVPSESTEAGGSSISIPESGGVAPSWVSFSGHAYPKSKIKVLRKSGIDGVFSNVPLASSVINDDGTFLISYAGLIGSDYLFALQVIDADGRTTGIISFTVDLLSQNLSVDNILLPPTLGFTEETIKRGGLVELKGYAIPKSIVEIDISGKIKGETRASDIGLWSYATGTSELPLGVGYARAREIIKTSTVASSASDYSRKASFRVTNLSMPPADLNNDESVSIADWSIFLFRWGSTDVALRKKIDMDGDGKITIADFSLFLSAIKL